MRTFARIVSLLAGTMSLLAVGVAYDMDVFGYATLAIAAATMMGVTA